MEPQSEMLSASLEDYLEAILLLERESRVARVSEIAEQLHVSRPSVTGALKNLAGRGLVSHERYGHATLTEEGERIALEVERRHVAIGISLQKCFPFLGLRRRRRPASSNMCSSPRSWPISSPMRTRCATGGGHDDACSVAAGHVGQGRGVTSSSWSCPQTHRTRAYSRGGRVGAAESAPGSAHRRGSRRPHRSGATSGGAGARGGARAARRRQDSGGRPRPGRGE
jgi:DNA-binding MarR family transcriptional regulator